ncbi:MAG: hypothetical protein AB7P37_21225 [Ramlibacter sp.]
MRGSIFLGAVAAMLASAGAGGVGGALQGRVLAVDESARVVTQSALNAAARYERGTAGMHLGGRYLGDDGQQRRAGYGWTNRHAQRVARKKRNQARHRAACRGRK